jgi:vanillate O-demethylase monooxygenase subunit
VIIDVGVAKAGTGATLENHDDADIRNFVLNFVTPATDRTCTYFWGSARGPGLYSDDPETFERITRRQESVFLEDAEILEAQQRHIDLLPHRKLQAYAVDAGSVHVRMMIEKMRKA